MNQPHLTMLLYGLMDEAKAEAEDMKAANAAMAARRAQHAATSQSIE